MTDESGKVSTYEIFTYILLGVDKMHKAFKKIVLRKKDDYIVVLKDFFPF